MPLETRLLDDSLACEVVGRCLWEPLDDRTLSELRDLWARHPVLVFRRQALSEHELAEFGAHFGPLERIVRTDWASPVRPEVGVISNLRDGQGKPIGGLGDGEIQWHSDQSYMLNPATGAMLYALELPPQGGTTSWVDCAQPMRACLIGSKAPSTENARSSTIASGSPAIRASTG